MTTRQRRPAPQMALAQQPRPTPKRSRAVLIAAMALAAITVGMLAASAAAQTTITFWPSSNPEEIAFATQIVDSWNAANPDIQVKMQPLPASRSTEEVLLAAIAARTTPDVAANIY